MKPVFDLVKELSFIRYGGTDDELRAANILLREIREAGGSGELMEFGIDAFSLQECSMDVTAPFTRSVPVIPFGVSGSLPNGGADLKLFYAGKGFAEDYTGVKDLNGYAVMLEGLTLDAYRLLCEKHASAFIAVMGKHYDDLHSSNAYCRNLRPKYREAGVIPGFMLSAHDATDLVRDGAETLHLVLRQTEMTNTSRNVLAVIPGTETPEESVVLTAHYDSVPLGTGAWDNATGSSVLMSIYRHFLQAPPRRTMRFIWCGSEEQGLLGSKAYIAQHEDLLPEIRFCFNFDMCGTVLGRDRIVVTGGKDLESYARQFCREKGVSADVSVHVHSSDSAPFADRGIPALGLSRGTVTDEIHTHHDVLFPLSAAALENNAAFFISFVDRTVNAVILPVDTGMPDEMKTELDKYFQRDTKK